MKIEVSEKPAYGKMFYEPISDDAIFLAKLIDRKYFTPEHLQLCADAGYIPEVKVIVSDWKKYLKVD